MSVYVFALIVFGGATTLIMGLLLLMWGLMEAGQWRKPR